MIFGCLAGQTPASSTLPLPQAEGRADGAWAEFSAEMELQSVGLQLLPGHRMPTPFYDSKQIQVAGRADGTWATRFPDSRIVTLPAERRRYRVDSSVTVSEVRAEQGTARLLAHDGACTEASRDLPGRPRFEGWEELLGVRVARYRAETQDSVSTAYYAPELDCFRVKYTYETMFWHGVPLRYMAMKATRLRRGAVDAGLFRVPR